MHIKRGNREWAISRLKPLLEKPAYRCQAAFYLYALEESRRDYRDVLLTDFCRQDSPAQAMLVEQLVKFEEDVERYETSLRKCDESLKKQRSRTASLKRKSALLQKEVSRLRFEIGKLEEIRKETESLRLK